MASVADYNVANASGAAVRSDLNNIFQAVVTLNSGTSEPSTMYPFMIWVDTTNNVVKMRNGANDGWLTMPFAMNASNSVDINAGTIDGVSLGATSAITSAVISGDLTVDTSTLKVDSSNNRVGIGIANPSTNLHIYSTADNAPHLLLENFQNADTDDAPVIELYTNDQTTGGISDNTDVGVIRFTGDEKDSGSKETYAEIRGVAHDPGSGTGNKGHLSFFVQSAGSLAETMTLDENRVGIGTTSPSHKIEVSDGAVASKYDATDHVAIRGLSSGQYIQYGSGRALSFVAIDTYPNSGASTKATIRTTGALEVGGGFTSGQGGDDGLNTGIQMNNYELTLNSENVSVGYVDIETDIGRAAYLGFSFGIYDSSLNVFSGNDDDWITYTDGYNNVVRVGLGSNAASGDIVRGVVFHH